MKPRSNPCHFPKEITFPVDMVKEGFEKLKKNNTTNCLYPYILKILYERPRHAYVLRKDIEKKFGFRPGSVTAYRVLYLLKKEGLVEKAQKDRTMIYNITLNGQKELKRILNFYRSRIKLLQ